MGVMEDFNRAVGHIDATLTEGADEGELRRLSGYSRAALSRVFSIFTGMTLSEYVRGRKLTEAAFELRDSGTRVIDVALRYGFASPDSFGAAFREFHGCIPSEVRDGRPFRVMSKLRLTLSVRGGEEMRISIQRKPAFTVAGLGREAIGSAECPAVWDALLEGWDEDALVALGSGQSFGACYGIEGADTINYLAGYDAADADAAYSAGAGRAGGRPSGVRRGVAHGTGARMHPRGLALRDGVLPAGAGPAPLRGAGLRGVRSGRHVSAGLQDGALGAGGEGAGGDDPVPC